jgi:hypothetical protein
MLLLISNKGLYLATNESLILIVIATVEIVEACDARFSYRLIVGENMPSGTASYRPGRD